MSRFFDAVLVAAAALWNRRANLLEVTGAVCLVVAASLVSAVAAWAVAGVCLVVAAGLVDRGRS